MNYQKVIEYKLQTLIDLMLTDGVSPSELSDNIFEEDYISITFSKKNENIIGKLHFYDESNIFQDVQMIYTYSKDKILLRIEEIVSGNYCLLWDRITREEELLEEILYFMSACYNSKQMEKFISSLPENLETRIREYMMVRSA